MQNKNKLTIQSLRKNGHKIKVTHLRRVSVNKKFLQDLSKPHYQYVKKGEFNLPPVTVLAQQVILSRGGETIIEIDTKNGKYYKANCVCSRKDSYNKRRGVATCLGRIFKQALGNNDSDIFD